MNQLLLILIRDKCGLFIYNMMEDYGIPPLMLGENGSGMVKNPNN